MGLIKVTETVGEDGINTSVRDQPNVHNSDDIFDDRGAGKRKKIQEIWVTRCTFLLVGSMRLPEICGTSKKPEKNLKLWSSSEILSQIRNLQTERSIVPVMRSSPFIPALQTVSESPTSCSFLRRLHHYGKSSFHVFNTHFLLLFFLPFPYTFSLPSLASSPLHILPPTFSPLVSRHPSPYPNNIILPNFSTPNVPLQSRYRRWHRVYWL